MRDRTFRRPDGCAWWRCAAFAIVVSLAATACDAALASQGPGVADGTAEPITRATAAAMALFPPIAVAVFAVARLLFPDRP